MTISAEQLALRQKHLGASDIPAILGLDPYVSPVDVWLQKTRDLIAEEGTTEAMDLGNDFEPVGVKRLAERLECFPVVDPPTAFAGNGVMIAHADCLLVPRDQVEKTGVLHRRVPLDVLMAAGAKPGEIKWRGDSDEWGEAGSDQIPVSVAAQAYGQAICLGADLVHVGCFHPKFMSVQFRNYAMPIVPEMAREIEEKCLAWWDAHVVKGVEPAGGSPSMGLVKRLRRVDGATVEVPTDVMATWIETREHRLAAEKQEKAAEAKLRAHMNGASLGTCDGYEVEDRVIFRKGYAVKEGSYSRLFLKSTK